MRHRGLLIALVAALPVLALSLRSTASAADDHTGRIVGAVTDRAGQPMAGAQVAFVPASNPTSLDGRLPVAVGAEGTFELTHVPAEGGTLIALADPGGPGQRIASETVEVAPDDTTTAALVMPEVVLTGRVTRSGAPGSGLRVTVLNRTPSNERRLAESLFALEETSWRGKSAITDEDGAFTVTANGPGPAVLQIALPDNATSFPSHDLEIPDSDAHYVELAVGGVALSGTLADRTTGQPLENASVCANPAESGAAAERPRPYVASSCARTDFEGGFRLEVEPGGYVVRANDDERGYRMEETPVVVPDSGLDDLKLSIERAPSIQVRALDAGGRAIGDAFVTACDDQGASVLRGGPVASGRGRPALDGDGRFVFQDLERRPYNVFAISMPEGTMGFRAGVLPGPEDAVVTLRPGTKVTVRAMGPGGPVRGAQVVVQAIDGHAVAVIHRTTTDPQGVAALSMPAGRVEVAVRKGHLEGRAIVPVVSGVEGEVTVGVASAKAPAAH